MVNVTAPSNTSRDVISKERLKSLVSTTKKRASGGTSMDYGDKIMMHIVGEKRQYCKRKMLYLIAKSMYAVIVTQEL